MFLFVYGIFVLLTTVGFLYLHAKYYDISSIDTSIYATAQKVGFFWFFGIPVIVWRYHKEIVSVFYGKDWVDDNVIGKKDREIFRKEYANLHRQITMEMVKTRKTIETIKENIPQARAESVKEKLKWKIK